MRRLAVLVALATTIVLLVPSTTAAHFHQSVEGVGKGTLHVSQFNPQSPLQRDCSLTTAVELEFSYDPTWSGDGSLTVNLPSALACSGEGANVLGFDACYASSTALDCTTSEVTCFAPTTCWGEFHLGSDGRFIGQGYSYTEVYDEDGYAFSTGHSYYVQGQVVVKPSPFSLLAADLDCGLCAGVELSMPAFAPVLRLA